MDNAVPLTTGPRPPHYTSTMSTSALPYSTPPSLLFPLFFLLNLVTMSDRAIIPGASQEFSAFISNAPDAPPLVVENPDAGLGILQAGFIGGYSVAIVLSSHYVHTLRWKTLVVTGLSVWWFAVLGSGLAYPLNSYVVLLVSRMASGVAEAAFHVVAPVLIQDRSGSGAGLWLSVYLMGMPLGLALGYIYGSFMASHENWGWQWAYFFECIYSLPLLMAMAFVRDNINGGILTGAAEYDELKPHDEDTNHTSDMTAGEDSREPFLSSLNGKHPPPSPANDTTRRTRKFTIFSEIKTCLSSPVLVTLALGYAAMIAVVASLGTFGGAFILALQLFDDERSAAVCFGTAAALAGVIGMPLGGKLVDRVLSGFNTQSSDTATLEERGSSSPGGIGGDKIDDSMRHSIVACIMPRINLLVVAAMLFIVPTLAMHQAVFFLSFLSIGWILLFATQTGIMLCAMLAVDNGHRPNALAFITLISHLCGDVPAPIVLGLIKDRLAPDCRVGKDGEFVDAEKCSESGMGVRVSLAIAYAWTVWSLIFFEIARRFALREKRKDDEETLANQCSSTSNTDFNSLLLFERHYTGDIDTLDLYHSKFQPPSSSEDAYAGPLL